MCTVNRGLEKGGAKKHCLFNISVIPYVILWSTSGHYNPVWGCEIQHSKLARTGIPSRLPVDCTGPERLPSCVRQICTVQTKEKHHNSDLVLSLNAGKEKKIFKLHKTMMSLTGTVCWNESSAWWWAAVCWVHQAAWVFHQEDSAVLLWNFNKIWLLHHDNDIYYSNFSFIVELSFCTGTG